MIHRTRNCDKWDKARGLIQSVWDEVDKLAGHDSEPSLELNECRNAIGSRVIAENITAERGELGESSTSNNVIGRRGQEL